MKSYNHHATPIFHFIRFQDLTSSSCLLDNVIENLSVVLPFHLLGSFKGILSLYQGSLIFSQHNSDLFRKNLFQKGIGAFTKPLSQVSMKIQTL